MTIAPADRQANTVERRYEGKRSWNFGITVNEHESVDALRMRLPLKITTTVRVP
jgi:hypothetical protein